MIVLLSLHNTHLTSFKSARVPRYWYSQPRRKLSSLVHKTQKRLSQCASKVLEITCPESKKKKRKKAVFIEFAILRLYGKHNKVLIEISPAADLVEVHLMTIAESCRPIKSLSLITPSCGLALTFFFQYFCRLWLFRSIVEPGVLIKMAAFVLIFTLKYWHK